MRKSTYEKPQIEVIEMEVESAILASSVNSGNPGSTTPGYNEHGIQDFEDGGDA